MKKKFLEVEIKRKLVTYHREGSIDSELLLVNENNLDGFWLKYDWQGLKKSYIIFNQRLDTTLIWGDGRLLVIGPHEIYPDIIVRSVGGRDADTIQIVTSIQKMLSKNEE